MDPYSLPEIQTELARVNRLVKDYFAGIADEQFFAHPPQVWSPAENLDHLCKSIRPIALALRVPRRALGLVWGAPGGSRGFQELVAAYRAALTAGGEAPAMFVSQIDSTPSDPIFAKQALLQRWSQNADSLEAAAASWEDPDLDKASLPHPLLGKLTLREMLFFTLYHNLHHVNDVRALLNQPMLKV